MVRRLLPVLLPTLLTPALAWAGYGVSSFKKENQLGANYWNAASALDSKPETAWMVDPEANNEGQWIELDVPSGVEVDKLGMIIGFAKSDDTFTDYARIKKAKVEIFNVSGGNPTLVNTAEVSFEDKSGWQIVELPDTKIDGINGKVKVTVLETYAGKDYPGMAVSEVRVHLKEFEAASFTVSRPFDSEVPDHGGENSFDGDAKSYWQGTGQTANFAFKAPGYGLASLGIQSGPKTAARPKTLEISANQTTTKVVLEDKPGVMQWALLPCLVGYTGGAWGTIEVKILDTYPGDDPMAGVAIAELKAMAGSIEEF